MGPSKAWPPRCGVKADVAAPPTDAEGGLFSETNDNSVGILLTCGTARVLLAGDAEAKSEEYMAGGPYTGPLTVVKVSNTHERRVTPGLGFRALLIDAKPGCFSIATRSAGAGPPS